jgi:hypothetical protein
VQKWETNFPKSQALFSSTVAFFSFVCAVHVMCRDQTRT